MTGLGGKLTPAMGVATLPGTISGFPFTPVRSPFIRLNIHQASDVPTIWEFQIFPPDK